ncbi:hypothetical protein LMG29660_06377 [Burkholderia puraquae]|uniref:Uncharacterized protein n=1 Tax=Burkholderia puraquae TaxID=1904757 RepID=A0A6J5EWC7_9BURK|nr:hypothetical protein LMG29660_06377 [Burkholderia puraquae]
MALFFRAQPRMFFLILLGRGHSEKNCAAFCRDLREFSRTTAGRDGRRIGAGGPFAGKARDCPTAARECGGRRSRPVRQGFQRLAAVTLTIEMHSVPIGRRRRMSTMPRPSADRARALTVRLHSVSSGVEAGMSTGMRFARVPALTVEIHSTASGFPPRISTSPTAYCVDPGLAFTVRIHRVASAFVGQTGAPGHACRAFAGSHSPLKYAGSRVGVPAGQARRNTHAA